MSSCGVGMEFKAAWVALVVICHLYSAAGFGHIGWSGRGASGTVHEITSFGFKIRQSLALHVSSNPLNNPSDGTTSSGSKRQQSLALYVSSNPFNNPFDAVAAETHPRTDDGSELPDSFEDAVERAVTRSMVAVRNGNNRIRIEFDTTVGDVTFTSLKNTLPMIKEMALFLAKELDLQDPPQVEAVSPFDMTPDEVEATPMTPAPTAAVAAPTPTKAKATSPAPSSSKPSKPVEEMTEDELMDLADAEIAAADEIVMTPVTDAPPQAQSKVGGTNVVIGVDPALGRRKEETLPTQEQMKELEEEEKPVAPVGLLTQEQLKEIKSMSREELAQVQKRNRLGYSDKGSIRLYFPDMGAAALARRDWKMGTQEAKVPGCMVTANIQNDPIQPTDKAAVLICPLHYETDFVQRVVSQCDEQGIPLFMVNPDLISMDQGFGVRARNLRKQLLSTFVTTYKLKTLAQGAVVREWPQGFSVWNECPEAEDGTGYTLLDSFTRDPTREMLDDMFDEANPVDPNAPASEPSSAELIINEVSGFFKGLSRL